VGTHLETKSHWERKCEDRFYGAMLSRAWCTHGRSSVRPSV